MILKSRGIVFNHIKFSETSIITRIYTENHGRLSFIVNNARNSKSRIKVNIFQPLVLVDLDYYYNNRKTIHRIKEIQVNYPFTSLPYNIFKCTIGIFLTEILEKAIKEEEPNRELFNFLYNSIIYLDSAEKDYSDFHIKFLISLTRYLGFFPVNNYSEINKYFSLTEGMFVSGSLFSSDCLDTDTSRLMHQYLSGSDVKFIPGREKRNVILEGILRFFYSHLQGIKEINSLRILNEVYADNKIEQS